MELQRAIDLGIPTAVFADFEQSDRGALASAEIDHWVVLDLEVRFDWRTLDLLDRETGSPEALYAQDHHLARPPQRASPPLRCCSASAAVTAAGSDA